MRNLFRTEIKPERSIFEIDDQTSMVMMGSCFSDHIGGILQQYKFPVLLNPFGVLYNPSSIAQAILLAINNVPLEEKDLVRYNNHWHSFSFHGSFSDLDASRVLERGTIAIQKAHRSLKNANILFVTFGTSWVYQWIETGLIVSNCHKIPTSKFKRFRLSVHEIVTQWAELINRLCIFNPQLQIIFTVSPVRHLKDGFHENQISKSTLLLAIDELINQFGNERTAYFPSYEIMNDDLRDYRFYSTDMLHISEKAVDYIFEKFSAVYFSEKTIQQINDIEALLLLKNHRILSNNSIEIEKFVNSALKKINELELKYPNIKFELERTHFKNLIERHRLI